MDKQQGYQAKTSSEIAEIESVMNTQPQDRSVPPEEVHTANNSEAGPDQGQVFNQDVADSQPAEAPEEERTSDTESKELLLDWKAAEPSKNMADEIKPVFIMGSIGAVVLIALVAAAGINFSTILAVFAVALGVVALYLTNRQEGHMESYEIYEHGITIAGRLYKFDTLKSFGVDSGDTFIVDLVPVQRFMPRLTLHLEPATAEEAISLLAEYLPREDREPDLVDRIYRSLGL